MNMAPRGTSGWEDRLWLQDRAGAFSDSSLLVLLFLSWTSFIHFSFAHSSVRLYMGQACPNHWQLFMDAVTVTVLLCNKGNQTARDFSYLSFRFSTSIRTEFHYPLADFIEGCAPGAGPGRDSMTLTLTQNYWKMAKKKRGFRNMCCLVCNPSTGSRGRRIRGWKLSSEVEDSSSATQCVWSQPTLHET